MAATLPETNFTVEQGDTLELVAGPALIENPITRAESPIDLTAANTKIWLTAKSSKSDADPGVFQKGNGFSGLAGVTPNLPATVEKNYATIVIDPVDTEAIAAPKELFYDVQLLEPSGRKTTIARGSILVVADVTNA